jgi:hypothetical protein
METKKSSVSVAIPVTVLILTDISETLNLPSQIMWLTVRCDYVIYPSPPPGETANSRRQPAEVLVLS